MSVVISQLVSLDDSYCYVKIVYDPLFIITDDIYLFWVVLRSVAISTSGHTMAGCGFPVFYFLVCILWCAWLERKADAQQG